MVLHRPDTPKFRTSLYGFVLLCERYYCHLFLLDRDIPEQKNSLKWSMNDQMRRRRHTGKRDQGSEVRVHRVRSLIGKKTKKTSFPVKFCALDSMFGALCAAAYACEVQQGAGGFLQLLVQLRLDLSPWPLIDGPLNGRRTSGSLVEASLFPEVRVLVAVEALAASTAGLPAVAASFVQGGQG